MDEERKNRLRQLIDKRETIRHRWIVDPNSFPDSELDSLQEADLNLWEALEDDAVVYRDAFYGKGHAARYGVDLVCIPVTIL